MTDQAALKIAEALAHIADTLDLFVEKFPVNYVDGRGAIVLHCECFHTFESRLNVQADVTNE